MEEGGKSLAETPTWAVATVITAMVVLGWLFLASLELFDKWLDRTKRKALLAALEKIRDELMLFGLLSLMMGHWIVYVAKICIKSSSVSRRFYPCALESELSDEPSQIEISVFNHTFMNHSAPRQLMKTAVHHYCPQGHESFVSHESMEQLHRFLFVLGTSHVFYSFVAIALAMIKIYSWKVWEDQAKVMALQRSEEAISSNERMRRMTTFISNHTSNSWSKHKVLVWLLCFSRQFWSSINRADYMALRLGFITTHQLPLTYDFLNYMLRSMEDEFRDIVGISIPLWIFGIACILLGFHGTNIYFWLSFLPAILILLVGSKLHHIVVKLALEITEVGPVGEFRRFNLRDELFWFGRPRFLLRIIQFISFQNAFEMASFIWSMWEIREGSCFTKNHTFLVIRLTFGVVSQIWCSFITFPLYVITTQMGSRFKKTIISNDVRNSLHKWQRRVKARQGDHPFTLINEVSTASSDTTGDTESLYTVNSGKAKGSSITRHASLEHHTSSGNQTSFYSSCRSEDDIDSDELEDLH
ncbi:MLO-like protein 4 isoform X1 [Daucus carota subsp. sativus]|uniref:MLO-like protein 4 isoform X1 n=1 Tax=Daucus carota subsp. sativus TaxID=79200 RepID=UPI0007EF31BB|nr:PREDICTED: MLO-like protein 4 isoform X1 [Daucus carota subsp. sativus]